MVAKQAATLDSLSGGRFTLGVGVGWSREEFDALGVPFERRGARTAEYVAAMRTLWRDDVASFDGEFVRFDSVRVNPKPFGNGASRLCSVATAMRRCAGWRVGRRLVRVQPRRSEAVAERIDFLRGCAPTADATGANCGWPWRCATRA